MLKLNLGCGAIHKKGFVNIDKFATMERIKRELKLGNKAIRIEKGAKFLEADIRKLPYKDGEVDYIESIDVIEHFGFYEVYDLLKEVKRVLKPGGIAKFMTLDFDALAREWIEVAETKPVNIDNYFPLSKAIYGNQIDEGNFHKSAWTPAIAYQIFKADIGFSNIEVFIYPKGCNTKPDMQTALWKKTWSLLHTSMLIKATK